jgi:hypothetical protein
VDKLYLLCNESDKLPEESFFRVYILAISPVSKHHMQHKTNIQVHKTSIKRNWKFRNTKWTSKSKFLLEGENDFSVDPIYRDLTIVINDLTLGFLLHTSNDLSCRKKYFYRYCF